MKKVVSYSLAAGLACFAFNAFGATQQVENTAYNVVIKQGEKVDLPNGKKAMANGQTHAWIVDDKTHEMVSQWCTGEQQLDSAGKPTSGAGYCTLFAANGDIEWVSFTFGAAGQPGQWTVMGGTGKYAGATGSGTTTQGTQSGDGYAWTSKSTGTLTTK